MAIAMLMVGGILGVVIHFTGTSMEMQSISMMRTIATAPFQQGMPGKPITGGYHNFCPWAKMQIESCCLHLARSEPKDGGEVALG